MFYADPDNENSSEKDDLGLEPDDAEDMVDNKGKFPAGASMPVTDLYRRKHKTDSKSVASPKCPPLLQCYQLNVLKRSLPTGC